MFCVAVCADSDGMSMPQRPYPVSRGGPSPVGGEPGAGLSTGSSVDGGGARLERVISVGPQGGGGVGTYLVAGRLFSDEVINAPTNWNAHLDDVIDTLTAGVQKSLVGSGFAKKLDLAEQTVEDRSLLVQEIDRLALTELLKSYPQVRGNDQQYVIASVINEVVGLGPIEPLWQDPDITEVIVNGPKDVYVERLGRIVRAPGARFRSQQHLLSVCQRVLAPLNRKLDTKDPLADGRLPDGSRVNAVHTATAPKGPLLTIRRFPEVNRSLVDLVGLGSLNEEMACTLAWLVRQRASLLVIGATGSGKTTLLNGLSGAIPHDERVVTIEDSLELRLDPRAHVAALEGRPPDAGGKNAVSIRALVKNALRMRPDRIVVGEVRDESALEMLQACNTGHEGSMSTVHANGPDEAVTRLAVMVAQGGDIPESKVEWLVGSALDIMVTVRRYKDGSRRVSGIYEVPDVVQGEPLTTIPLWEWERTGAGSDGKFVGNYVQRNNMSERLTEKLGLKWEPMPSWEQVQQICGTPA